MFQNLRFSCSSQQARQSNQLDLNNVLTFAQLETLTNLLMNETLEMQNDFEQKFQFTCKQQQKIASTENEVRNIEKRMQ